MKVQFKLSSQTINKVTFPIKISKVQLTIVVDGFDVVGGEDPDTAVEVAAPPGLFVLGDQTDDVTNLNWENTFVT